MNAPPKTELKLPPSAIELRRARARRLAIRFSLGVGIPTLIALIYTAGLASPYYDARAVVAVESNQDRTTMGGAADGDKTFHRDARMLRDYLRSRAVMDQIDMAHYRSDDIDWWARLGGEEALDYYRDMVDVSVEPASNVLHLRVRAFSADHARTTAETIVGAAQAWIDRESAAAALQLVAPAEAEVERAKQRLLAARAALPEPPATDDRLAIEHELAQKQLDEAVETLAIARLETATVARRLVVVSPPARPDGASGPKVGWTVATVLVTSAVLVAVLSLLGAAIREHANF